jgi:pantothenate kinase
MIDELVARARGLRRDGERPILGITGAPGAGKSTLAGLLVRRLTEEGERVALVPMDGFHLADVTLERLGRRDRKGAIDTFDGDGYLALLRRARTDLRRTVYAPGFERHLEQPIAGNVPVDPDARLVVTEGNYLLADAEPWPLVRAELAEVWYCDLEEAVRRERLIARHVLFGKTEDEARRWVAAVDDRNARLIAAGRHRADLLVDMAGLQYTP